MHIYKPERGSRFLLGFNSRMPKIRFKTDLWGQVFLNVEKNLKSFLINNTRDYILGVIFPDRWQVIEWILTVLAVDQVFSSLCFIDIVNCS